MKHFDALCANHDDFVKNLTETYFIAGTWFGSEKHCKGGGWPSLAAMNEELVRRWNSVVGPRDRVFHLGGFGSGRGQDLEKILAQLQGKKTLLALPEDRAFADVLTKYRWECHFTAIYELPDAVLSPWPMLLWPDAHKKLLFYGSPAKGKLPDTALLVSGKTPQTREELCKPLDFKGYRELNMFMHAQQRTKYIDKDIDLAPSLG